MVDDVLGRGTVLAGRYQLTDPRPCDLPGATEWAANDQILVRSVVVRVFPAAGFGPALDGARRAALVADPRLVRVLDVGSDDDIAYVVTERVTGQTLARLVARQPLSADQARAIVGEAANALEAARRRGVHHLALRPSVLSVSDGGRVVVSGTALDAALLGRPVGDARTTSRADAADLVRLVYTALTGHWPGPREMSDGLPTAPEERGVPVPPASLAADVPGDLNTLCAVTLGSGDDGPLSPADLVRELEPWGEIRIQAPSRPAAPPVAEPPATAGQVVRQSVRSTFAGASAPPARPRTSPPAWPSRDAVTPPMGVPSALAPQPVPPVVRVPPPDASAAASVPPAAGPSSAPVPPAASDTTQAPFAAPPTAATDDGVAPGSASDGPFPTTATPPTIPTRTPTGATTRISAFGPAAGAALAAAASGGSATSANRPTAATPPTPAIPGTPPTPASGATPAAPARSVPTRTPTRPAALSAPGGEQPRPAQPAPGGYGAAHLPPAGQTPPSFEPPQMPPSGPGEFDFGQFDEQPPRRTGVGIALAIVGLLVVVAIGFAAKALFSGHQTPLDPGGAAHTTAQSPTGTASSPNTSPTASPTAPTGAPAVIASIQSIDPTAPGGEHQDEVGKAFDGNPATFWRTLTYKRDDFAGFKPAVGLQLNLAQTATVTTVTLHVNGTGGNVEVRTGDATTPTAGTVLASGPMSQDTVLHLSQPQTTSSLVIWFTKLPTTADGSFRVELSEIELG